MTLRQAVQEAAKVMRKHPSLAGVLKPLVHQGRMTLKYRDAQLASLLYSSGERNVLVSAGSSVEEQ